MSEQRRIRIGIDTGGTFTDVVAFDEATGELVTTKTPSTPADPADGFMAAIDKVLAVLGLAEGRTGRRDRRGQPRHHGRHEPAARGQGRRARVSSPPRATRRCSRSPGSRVPDGYGNSYFWVKPDRIVPRRPGHGRRAARLDFTGAEIRPFDEDGAVTVARWFRERGHRHPRGLLPALLRQPRARGADARGPRPRSTPTRWSPSRSEVLREYREYERAMTTLVDAAVKPGSRAYVTNIKPSAATLVGSGQAAGVPFYVMKSNGGVLSADEVVHQPITTVLSGPAAGALGAALIAQGRRLRPVLTCDGGGTSTDVSVVVDGEPALTTEGTVGAYPSKIPMIDVVTVGAGGGSIAWLSPEGTLKVGPAVGGRRPRAALLRPRAAPRSTITDAHVVLGRIPPHLLGGEIPLDVAAARSGRRRAGRPARALPGGLRHRRAGDLRVEPGQRAAPGHGQARPRRPRLHADHVRRVRLAAAVPADGHPRHPDRAGAAEPRQRLGVRAAHRRREERLRADPRLPAPTRSTPAALAAVYDALTGQAARRAGDGGLRATSSTCSCAPPTCATSGRPSRCACPCRTGPVDPGADRRGGRRRSTPSTGRSTATTSPATRASRSSGSTCGSPASGRSAARRSAPGRGSGRTVRRPRDLVTPRRCASTPGRVRRHPGLLARRPGARATSSTGPAIIEEFGSTVPLHPGFTARVDDYRNLIVTRKDQE